MSKTKVDTRSAPRIWKKIALFGPGLALAATSVGAGDMISTLEGSGSFGMGLVWIAVIGVIIKFALTEASGRLQLSSPSTLIAKISSIHIIFAWAFLIAVLILTTLYGAALSSVAALALTMFVPSLPMLPTTVAIILISGLIVFIGNYDRFEKYMIAFAVFMFLGVIVISILTASTMDDPETIVKTATVSIPGGSIPAALAMIGGVGGSATIAIYAYWIREKGWNNTTHLKTMRNDALISYIAILSFVVSLSVVGTGFIFGTGLTISGDAELAALGAPLAATFGEIIKVGFFVSFFVVVFSSIIGGFNGYCYMLGDCLRVVRGIPDERADSLISPQKPLFNVVLIFQIAAALVIMLLGKPVQLVLAYAISGAFFLPLLVVGFLILLNRKSVPISLRNRTMSNTILIVSLILFGALAISTVLGQFSS